MGSEFTKPTASAKAFFESLVGDLPDVLVRPMFGHLSAFVNGNMFSGFFGDHVFVRLDEEDRTELLRVPGASTFAPMPGRAMKEYVNFPAAWRGEPRRARPWVEKSLAWARTLPPKKKSER